jgi:putative SOS response-associated peptidase YedK
LAADDQVNVLAAQNTQSQTSKNSSSGTSFVLVTAVSLGGMVDVHDRRPVAVSLDDALRWLDPALPPEEAVHLARVAMLDADLFEWNAVDRALNSGAEGAVVKN